MTGTGKALKILAENEVKMARQFARLMWPNSPCWEKVYNIGAYGATKGVGMWLVGGSFLGKLRDQGLIRQSVYDGRFVLTDKGEERLSGEISLTKEEQMYEGGQ